MFAAAFVLFLFTLFRIRAWIIHNIPQLLSSSITAGVGLFLVFVGLKSIGVVEHKQMFITLGEVYNQPVFFTCLGLVLIFWLLRKGVSCAFMIAIILNWAASLVFGHSKWQGLVSLPPSLDPTFFKLDFSIFQDLASYKVLFSIFLVTLFDSTCALTALAQKASFLDENRRIVRLQKVLLPDSLCSMAGALLGTGSLAIHLESMSGIQAGGRRGLSAIVVSLCFLLCLFFYPLVSSIPHFATAPVLVAIGLMMSSHILELKWNKAESYLFLATALIMPLAMSIYYGFVLGFWGYVLLAVLQGNIRKVSPLCWFLSIVFLIHFFFYIAELFV